jgi:hypothetical protein
MIKKDKPIQDQKNVQLPPNTVQYVKQPIYTDAILQNLLYSTEKQNYEQHAKLNQVEAEMTQIKQILADLAKSQVYQNKTDPQKIEDRKVHQEYYNPSNGMEQFNLLKQSSGSNDFWSDPTNVLLIQILIISGIIVLLLIAFAAICAVGIGFANLSRKNKKQQV